MYQDSREAYHKKQQKWSLTDRKCIACIEQVEEESRYAMCKVCEKRKHMNDYRSFRACVQ